MLMKRTFDEIMNHSKSSFDELDKEIYEKFIETIVNSENIFVLGAGRSGLVAKSFAMRLMHLGKKVCVLGENTPIIDRKIKNVLIAISGSGKTDAVNEIVNQFSKNNFKIISLTSNNKSQLANLSEISINLKNYDKSENEKEDYYPMPLGTSFELATLLILESMIPDLMKRLKVTEEDMKKRHVPFEFIDVYLGFKNHSIR